ncbi:MAG: L-threonylcarbamoyladenylate synthase [Flavobacteriales bacterium]
MSKTGSDILRAKQALEAGKLVGIPTETVYGLAGNAFDTNAIASIFKVKNRPAFDPLIIHTHSLNTLKDLVFHVPEYALKLAEKYWPGPITILMERSNKIHNLITNGSEIVGVRIPNHELTLQLLKSLDFPLAAPSANPFGYISPTSAAHVEAQLGESVEYILDGGPCKVGIESTVIGLNKGIPTIYRKGGISREEIEATIGKVEVMSSSSSNPNSPGLLEKHYSPKTPFVIGDIKELITDYQNKNTAILSFQKKYRPVHKNDRVLSESGNLTEAAVNLFSFMRELDQLKPDIILTELLPEKGLGASINDRLKRAAAK